MVLLVLRLCTLLGQCTGSRPKGWGISRALADCFAVGPEPIGRWRWGQEVRVAAGYNSTGDGNLGPWGSSAWPAFTSTLGFQT